MKRRSAWLSFAACALTAAAPCRSPKAAPSPVAGHSDVQMVGYANGCTGFFHRSTGKLYVYDSSLTRCIAVRQVARLGDALVDSDEFPGSGETGRDTA